jgi:hypothetical protein
MAHLQASLIVIVVSLVCAGGGHILKPVHLRILTQPDRGLWLANGLAN